MFGVGARYASLVNFGELSGLFTRVHSAPFAAGQRPLRFIHRGQNLGVAAPPLRRYLGRQMLFA